MTFPNQDRCGACGKAASAFLSFRGVRLGVDHADCRAKVAQSLPQRARLAQLELRTVSLADFEVRSSSDSAGIFEGYANRFGSLDDYGTRWREGAWSAGGLDDKPYPLLWMHDPYNPVGSLRANEDKTGLAVEGKWDNSDEGKRARDRYDSGSAPELSVGFLTRERDPKDRKLITSSELREVSQLTLRWASSPDARITGVRMSVGSLEQRSIEGSFEDLQEDLREALQGQFGGGPGNYLWLLATFPDRVIYCAGGFVDGDDATWQVSYQQNDDDSFTFGQPEAVEVTQVVQPRSSSQKDLEIRRRILTSSVLLEEARPLPWIGKVSETRATWDTAYINDLPDSAFLYVEDGGEKDADAKTKPRSLRHFPYKDSGGKVDLPHLRNALARIPQSSLSQSVKDDMLAKAKKIAKANGIGDDSESK